MSQDIYTSPEANLQEGTSSEPVTLSLKQVLFSFHGRIRRKTYWLTGLPMMLIFSVLIGLLGTLAFGGEQSGVFMSALLILYIPLILISFALQAKRWHDRNKSAWWTLISFVPVIGPIWALVENGFLEGDLGANNYGQPNK